VLESVSPPKKFSRSVQTSDDVVKGTSMGIVAVALSAKNGAEEGRFRVREAEASASDELGATVVVLSGTFSATDVVEAAEQVSRRGRFVIPTAVQISCTKAVVPISHQSVLVQLVPLYNPKKYLTHPLVLLRYIRSKDSTLGCSRYQSRRYRFCRPTSRSQHILRVKVRQSMDSETHD
jgi:hypothetical protein